ncbi:beta-1,2-xylosyltransferase [Pistacia vera]|uniref:beta-1,2-xylosyltransferase n=1 Tax=Pistacia vera TaxID=55513 RepID=UPI001262DBA0|nr:beta-1,2-xylosyltransferase [Pistacia vera]
MNRNKSKLLKILLALFALNSLSLYLYFSHSHSHNRNSHDNVPFNERSNLRLPHQFSKAWPILPSYLPWSQNPKVRYRSCEAYFGNGFTTRVDLLPTPTAGNGGGGGGGGWFRCFYSETLRSSICEGGKLKMNHEKIAMSKGGERIEDVMGRRDEEELPEYQNGAFQIEGDGVVVGFRGKRVGKRLVNDDFLNSYVPRGGIDMHTMRGLIGSIEVVDAKVFDECEQWVEEPTLLVTRFEYANVFHTFTDWYSAYVSSRVTGLPNRPHVVFVDGHSQTQLEETWEALFSSIRYAKNFSGPVCFRHAILSPLGYETPLFKGLSEDISCHGASAHELWQNPDDSKTARMSEFGEMIRAAFGFQVNRHRIEKPGSVHNVLFVRREDYLAHPRHGGKVESRLSNEQEVFDSLQSWVSNNPECKINLVNGLFAHMSMKDQVRAIQDASVIIGAHGAGLTHIVSAMPKTVILEIVASQYRRPHFQLIAQWKGLEYHAIYLDGSYAKPAVVTDKLSSIVKNLGC